MRTCCLPSFTSFSSSSPLVASSPASRRLRKVHRAAKENEEQERELDEKTREALRLPSKSQDDDPASLQKGNKRFGNVEGGKYGLGNRVDKALDATTDELQFKIGAIVCVTLPVLLLIFGPRPPSEY